MILVVLPKYINSGIITSQHVAFASELSKKTAVWLAVHCKFKDSLLAEGLNFNNIIWYTSYWKLLPKLSGFSWVYVRSLYSFIPIYIKKFFNTEKFNIFYDFRALSYIEVDYVQKNKIKKIAFFLLEYLCYRLSDARGAISYKLQGKLIEKFGEKSVYVMPCCINYVKQLPIVNSLKRTKNDHKIRFVYVGSINKWQCIPEVLTTFEEIAKQMSSTLTIITQDLKKAEAILSNFKSIKDSIELYSLPHTKLIQILPRFDFGFLIRENSPINNLSSPVKFLEYTSNGVIPIISEHLGDYSEAVEELNLGIVLDDNFSFKIEDLVTKLSDKGIIQRLLEFSENFTFNRFVVNHPLY